MASTWIARIRVFFAVTAVVVAINVVRQLYRWFAFEEERVELVRLNQEVEGTALDVMKTQLRADSLRVVIQQMDTELRTRRRELQRVEQRAGEGGLPPLLFQDYRHLLDETNGLVAQRNRHFEEWRRVVEGNHLAVRRYNLLADSIRGLGTRMGEPYLTIPSPAEVATRRGLPVPPRPAAATAAPTTPN